MNYRIGALSPKLHEQVNEQSDLELTVEDLKFEQRLTDAVILLQLRSIITFGEQQKVGKRLVKIIDKRVLELAKEKGFVV